MTVPFVASLRARPGTIRIGSADSKALMIRVEVPEVWDVVRIETSPNESVRAVKNAALQELLPRADQREYVMKLRGYEVLEESGSLEDVGAVDGSIFLLTSRRRRPVR
ncbi:MAG TPA: hypothetical protein VJ672_07500 [Gemmatimonadaceae bacterium]|nr:hypothetical protein [Gemmatimonadaceae bacterium]